MRKPVAFVGVLFLGFHFLAAAQTVTTLPPAPPGQAAVSNSPDDQAPVTVPEPTEKALRYHESGNWLWLLDEFWGLLIPVLFLFTGFSARIRNWAQRLGRKWFLVIGIYFLIFAAVSFAIDLPLSYYEEFVRQHDYGLSNQDLSKWMGDSIKGLIVSMVVGFLFLWVPYLLLKKSPRRWWFYTGLVMVPFLFLAQLVTPIWINPLFNDFGPMKDKALETRILDLARRAGIEGGRVFEVNKSVDTNAVNAYVTGFMDTKRIVLWDTILTKLNERELLTVMGHEMGHYVLGHVWKGILFSAVLIMITLYVAHRTAGFLIDRFKDRFGFDRLSDPASLPLILLLVAAFSLLVTPAVLTFTRYQEHEADRFGLEITRDNHAAANAFVKLQQENLGIPRPGMLYKLWRESHPPIGERIDFCNEYRPWLRGEPLVYGHLFHD